jgi:NADH dehydrogenase FAD-containing subunit
LGLAASPDGRVAVDAYLRVRGLANVFAVGDLAAPPVESVGSGLATTRMGCVSAMPMGAHAADQVGRQLRGLPLVPFGFRYFVQCISVGRRRGVIVSVDADDRPTGRSLRGARAALVKELVCRFVLSAIRLERLFPGLYAWPGRRSLSRLPRTAPNQLPG